MGERTDRKLQTPHFRGIITQTPVTADGCGVLSRIANPCHTASRYCTSRRCTGLLDYWTTGLLDYWTTGLLDYWTTGLLDYWTTGLLDYWTTGLLDYWTTGLLDVLLAHRIPSLLNRNFVVSKSIKTDLVREYSCHHTMQLDSGSCGLHKQVDGNSPAEVQMTQQFFSYFTVQAPSVNDSEVQIIGK